MVSSRSLLLVVAPLLASLVSAGCGDAGEEDVAESSDELTAAASHVSRTKDGAFSFTAPIAAKVTACTGACVDRDVDVDVHDRPARVADGVVVRIGVGVEANGAAEVE